MGARGTYLVHVLVREVDIHGQNAHLLRPCLMCEVSVWHRVAWWPVPASLLHSLGLASSLSLPGATRHTTAYLPLSSQHPTNTNTI